MRISDWSSDVCSSDLEELAALVEGRPRLRKRARRLARFHNDRTQRQRTHRRVSFREEEAIVLRVLAPVAQYRNLRDQQMFGCDELLQFGILAGIIFNQRRHDNSDSNPADRKSTRLNSGQYCASRMPSFA